MIVVDWASNVNKRFYAFNKKPKENTKSFESVNGRNVAYLTNTKSIMTFSCSLALDVGTEEDAFWEWFNNDLGGLSGAFTCDAIGNKNYKFTAIPSPSGTDQVTRVVDLEFEEVY